MADNDGGTEDPKDNPGNAEAAANAEPPEKEYRDESGRVIKPYRYCESCWGANRGYGTVYSTNANGRSYLKCDKALPGGHPCGHTWPVDFIDDEIVIKRNRQVTRGRGRGRPRF